MNQKATPTKRSRLDTLFLAYFISHIPITLCVDLQPLIPTGSVPRPLLVLNDVLTRQLRDPFMVLGNSSSSDLTWFRSLLACELVLQLPFFFYAVWALWVSSPRRHLPLLVYGAHVSTTMAPILGMLLFGNIDRSCHERMLLASMYVPYLLIPLAMVCVSYSRCASMISAKLKSQ
ncbi:Transmembrane protein 97 [Coemansia sp. RSA 1646]|nr:Transmembrane protein 97 [Coemansia sp. RSA 1646]KAJ1770657.1 Transmembrane protein 97 [Coemansia sp. RSA 1843]KAJ2093415.1 Transmembrane protein 97 [Coemansia sp. RSA 986]KAJ2217222.1 Transmembrane protein 97 [Coemansia sp. RSA 487]